MSEKTINGASPNEFEYYQRAIEVISVDEKLKTHKFEGKLRMYDHSEGYDVAGHEKKQWLYLYCRECGYELSFKKLFNK